MNEKNKDKIRENAESPIETGTETRSIPSPPPDESDEMFRSIVENSHAGIFIVDESFHFIYANDMLSVVLGYPLEEIIGDDFRKFLDTESLALVADRTCAGNVVKTFRTATKSAGLQKKVRKETWN